MIVNWVQLSFWRVPVAPRSGRAQAIAGTGGFCPSPARAGAALHTYVEPAATSAHALPEAINLGLADESPPARFRPLVLFNGTMKVA